MLSAGSFGAMGTTVTVVVEDGARLEDAVGVVRAQITEIDRVCSRFREDSELTLLNEAAGGAAVVVSPLLEEAVLVGLAAARMTDGLVDPTVGRCLEAIGYTITFGELAADGPLLELQSRPAPGWRGVAHDPVTHTLRLPAGIALDLGASGKAWASDRAADAVSDALGIGVAVNCGGDVAFRGRAPESGWPVRVADQVGAEEWQDVLLVDGGLATSGTTARRWRRGGVELHHIIDPATGLPAQTPWRMVSVAAASCLEANAAATAAIILGGRALGWLEALRLPARLVARDGRITYAGGWRESP
jgi:thiamine biosynthesis lipoprotein ApbE